MNEGRLPQPGDKIGRYQLSELIGSGASGAVFLANDVLLDTPVCLKLLHPAVAHQPEILERFKREVLLARRITHPGVCRLFDLHIEDGFSFLTMEHVDGVTLRDLIANEGALPVERSCALLRSMCDGLGAAHAVGVVHRDLKPRNIMVRPDDEACILDFGIATAMDVTGLTRPGVPLGTRYYIAPEVWQGETATQLSDIFALGVIFYNCLTAGMPWSAEHGQTLLQAMTEGPPPVAPSRIDPRIPKRIDNIVFKMVALAPSDRFQSVREVIDAIDAAMPRAEESSAFVEPTLEAKVTRTDTASDRSNSAPSTAEGIVPLPLAKLGLPTVDPAVDRISLLGANPFDGPSTAEGHPVVAHRNRPDTDEDGMGATLGAADPTSAGGPAVDTLLPLEGQSVDLRSFENAPTPPSTPRTNGRGSRATGKTTPDPISVPSAEPLTVPSTIPNTIPDRPVSASSASTAPPFDPFAVARTEELTAPAQMLGDTASAFERGEITEPVLRPPKGLVAAGADKDGWRDGMSVTVVRTDVGGAGRGRLAGTVAALLVVGAMGAGAYYGTLRRGDTDGSTVASATLPPAQDPSGSGADPGAPTEDLPTGTASTALGANAVAAGDAGTPRVEDGGNTALADPGLDVAVAEPAVDAKAGLDAISDGKVAVVEDTSDETDDGDDDALDAAEEAETPSSHTDRPSRKRRSRSKKTQTTRKVAVEKRRADVATPREPVPVRVALAASAPEESPLVAEARGAWQTAMRSLSSAEQRRGIMRGDLPLVDHQRREIDQLARSGEYARAASKAYEALKSVEATKIDKSFVDLKLRRLNARVGKINDATQRLAMEQMLEKITSLSASGDYAAANQWLNKGFRALGQS